MINDSPAHDSAAIIQQGPVGKATPITGHPTYKRLRLSFVMAVAFQLLALSGLASSNALTVATGTPITLRTIPVDPRDMFRGDYVRLAYAMDIVETSLQLRNGQDVYVVLARHGQYWEPLRYADKMPALNEGEVALKGKTQWKDGMGRWHVRYGIEQFFVEEGKGAKLETAKHLRVQVSVDRSGHAVVTGAHPES